MTARDVNPIPIPRFRCPASNILQVYITVQANLHRSRPSTEAQNLDAFGRRQDNLVHIKRDPVYVRQRRQLGSRENKMTRALTHGTSSCTCTPFFPPLKIPCGLLIHHRIIASLARLCHCYNF